jgi:uncharacterized membrane protein
MAALVMAMLPIDAIISAYMRKARTWVVPAIFLLCSVGVYIGLVDRVNSWDPLNLRTITVIASAPVHIASSPLLAIVVVLFAAFLWMFYRAATTRWVARV